MPISSPPLTRARDEHPPAREDGSRPEIVAHEAVERPWGWFRTLARNAGFQVKEIFVRPGGKLSLQRHRHRAEHWIVASGEAFVTVANRELCLGPRGNVDIPPCVIHRLENRSDGPLRVVEVQFGDYLGEDDIERLADEYARVEMPSCSAERATCRTLKG